MAKKTQAQAKPAVQEDENLGFTSEAQSLELLPLLCLGSIEVGDEIVQSENGPYEWVNLTFVPEEGGRKATFRLMFLPRWFARDFNAKKELAWDADICDQLKKRPASSLNEEEKDHLFRRGQWYVRRSNIYDKDSPAALQILAGVGTEKHDIWQDVVNQIGKAQQAAPDGQPDSKTIYKIIKEVASRNIPWLYYLKQERQKNDEGEKVPQDRYTLESGDFQIAVVGSSVFKSMVKRAQKNGVVTFELPDEG